MVKRMLFPIFILMAMLLSVGCSEDASVDQEKQPSITLTKGQVTESSVSFTVIPVDADACSYICMENTENLTIPDAVEIMKSGIALTGIETQVITVPDLTVKTEYVIVAAVSAGDGAPKASSPLTISTSESIGPLMDVKIENTSTTASTLTFTVVPTNASECRYDVYKEGGKVPDVSDIMLAGVKISAFEPTTITLEDRIENVSYIVYAAVEASNGVQQVMATATLTTQERPAPEVLPTEYFTTEGAMSVFRDYNYVVKFENENYDITLDFYADANGVKKPVIPEHEYIFVKDYNDGQAWTINNVSTRITSKKTSANLNLEKGSMSVTRKNGSYVIAGTLVTSENKAFSFEYTGQLIYPYGKFDAGVLDETETGSLITLTGNPLFTLKLDIRGAFAAGEYTIAAGTLGAATTLEANDKSQAYRFTAGSVIVTNPDALKYEFECLFTTTEGYLLSVTAAANLEVEIVEPDKEYVFTSAEGYAEPDATGYVLNYTIEFKGTDFEKALFTFCETSFDGTILPNGTYLYNAASENGAGTILGQYTSIELKGGTLLRLDQGTVTVSRSGAVYTVIFDIKLFGSESRFKARYEGDIDITDYSGGEWQ